MSRRYSSSKGKSGSTKPQRKSAPSWMRYKPDEAEMLIAKLAKEGKSPSQIGLILRDIYGIPDVKNSVGKKLTKILEEKKLIHEIPEDLLSLMKRNIAIMKHIEKNKQDETAKRGLILTESKIRALIKYYKKTKRLNADWKFEPEKIRFYI